MKHGVESSQGYMRYFVAGNADIYSGGGWGVCLRGIVDASPVAERLNATGSTTAPCNQSIFCVLPDRCGAIVLGA